MNVTKEQRELGTKPDTWALETVESFSITKQDSVKVTKGMNGKYSFEVKIYFDSESKEQAESVCDKIEKKIEDLKERFDNNT